MSDWGYSSAGRASALQAEGQRFDPVSLHHLRFPNIIFQIIIIFFKKIVDVIIIFDIIIHAFWRGVIAQLGERLHGMQEVIGSIPFSSTNVNKSSLLWGYSSAGRASALQAEGQRFDPVYLHHLSFSFFPEILDQSFKKYKQILTCCSIETKFFANFRVAIVIIAIIEN